MINSIANFQIYRHLNFILIQLPEQGGSSIAEMHNDDSDRSKHKSCLTLSETRLVKVLRTRATDRMINVWSNEISLLALNTGYKANVSPELQLLPS